MSDPSPRDLRPRVARAVAIASTAVAYAAVARFSTTLSFPPDDISAICVPNAVALAAVLVFSGGVAWPFLVGIAAAELLVDRIAGLSWTTAAGFAVANALEVGLAARLLRRERASAWFDTLGGTTRFLVVAGLVAPLASGFVAAAAAVAGTPEAAFGTSVVRWTLGDGLAHVAVAPALVIWLDAIRARERPRRAPEGLALAVALAAAIAAALRHASPAPIALYLPLPVLLWAAVRFGSRGVAAATAALAIAGVAASSHGSGPFVGASPEENVLSLQLFLFTAAVPVLLLAALLAERTAAREGLERLVAERTAARDRQVALARESEARFRSLVESMKDIVFVLDTAGRHVAVHGAWVRDAGLAPESFLGRTAVDILGERAGARHLAAARAAAAGETVVYRWSAPDGAEERSFETTLAPVRGPDGRVDLVLGVGRDVTKMVRAEQVLRDSEARFREMADTAPAMLWVTDATAACTFLSRAWTEFTGQPAERGLGMGWIDAVHPDDRDAARLGFVAAAEARVPYRQDFRLRTADGDHRWVIDTGRPRFDADGRYQGHLGSIIDIHERKLAEEALREADRRKDEFLAVLSHELRNPLAPIRNALAMLQRSAPGSEQAGRAVAVIDRQVSHVTRLVDDLLDVSRIARGKIQVRRDRLDLADVARRTAEDHRSLFVRQGLELDVAVPDDEVPVDGDAVRLAQVIGNLLQNAAKFTPRGGRVALSLAREGDRAVVRVRDTGAGVEPEMRERIFEPFTQAAQGLDRGHGGLGLGLALARGLVSHHGGTVEVRSDGAGLGAEFAVRLPLATVAATPAPAPARLRPEPRRVLVVEDNEDGADSLREVLEMDGHVVEVAYDGPSGLEKAVRFRPDVILCDIGLPGMDGYAVARAVRGVPDASGVRLVALTGYALPEDRERARAAGFDLHLTKPASVEDLQRAVVARPEA